MKVQKRNGNMEDVSFDKILKRITCLCNEPHLKKLNIDPTIIAQKVCSEIYDGVTTEELDILSSETAISLYSTNSDYKELASRIIISNHHKNTPSDFKEVVNKLYNYNRNNEKENLINKNLYDLVMNNIDIINKYIDYNLDYKFDYFGFKTLEKSYLLKVDGKIIERPQHLYMRVALSIHRNNFEKAFETYLGMANQDFIHATPTLFNAGTKREQFSSCFLLMMQEDSVQGIYDTLTDCAKISKYAGGIGLAIHNIRPKGTFIAGTNGYSNGIVPMLQVYNYTARYIDQGGGKRNGSFAIYLEPWHADIFEFLELKKNNGNELERARDLFYGLWVCDLFMKRVKNNEIWSLFCPHQCPELFNVWGDEFEELYKKYESEGKYIKQVKSQDLWFAILTSQIETGTPYLVYKDACNKKSNQQNLGTIKSSNLCTEIVEYTSPEETAVCNLASISLKACLKYKNYEDYTFRIYSKPGCLYCDSSIKYFEKYNINYEKLPYTDITLSGEYPTGVKFPQIYLKENQNYRHIGGYTELEQFMKPDYDYEKLKNIAKILVRNLNNIIDYNFYPTEKTELSNRRHRPIGIGVQGFANVLYEMKTAFDQDEGKELNNKIFETIYFGALEASCELSQEREIHIKKLKKIMNEGIEDHQELYKKLYVIKEELERDEYLGTYSSYINSPMYHGKLQFDLWDKKVYNSLHDWDNLRLKISKYGIRNSLLVAPMPTASTSQILGNYECFEPVMTNIYTRRVLSGEYMVINDYLVEDLKLFNLWNTSMKDKLIANDGSVQYIEEIPQIIKDRYKTIWELKQKHIIDMSIDRGKFICQSQSLNLFMESPTFSKLSSMHFYAWQNGIKTGMYYLRTRPSSKAIQFTVNVNECTSCGA
jgi:ribonucleoside-diphosphate reductase subunit M1